MASATSTEHLKNQAGAALQDAKETAGAKLAEGKDFAADQLERFSQALREKDLGGLVRDAEDFARRQPAAFFAAAAIAGFLAVRFLKASQR